MKSSPVVYIVILNWNGWKDSISCLESLSSLEYNSWHAFVIDNGSTDDSIAQLKAWGYRYQNYLSCENFGIQDDGKELISLTSRVTLVVSNSNLGFAAGCNLGIDYAIKNNADYVFLLNNDATVTPSTLNYLIEVSQVNLADIVGACVFEQSTDKILFSGKDVGKPFFLSTNLKYNNQQSHWESIYAEGSGMLLSRALIKQRLSDYGHVFDPKLFMYCEDTDLCLYAKSKHYKCVISRDAKIFHKLAASSGGQGNSRTFYYITRNRIFIANRWLKWHMKILFHVYYYPSRIILYILSIRTRNWKVSSAIFQALMDGYIGRNGIWNQHI